MLPIGSVGIIELLGATVIQDSGAVKMDLFPELPVDVKGV